MNRLLKGRVGRPRLEIFKFGVYVFVPIGILYFVESGYFQDTYVKPYTLFPSAGKSSPGAELFPGPGESEDEWRERMERTAPIRRRAKEIYHELKSKDSGESTQQNNLATNPSNVAAPAGEASPAATA